MTLEQNKSAQEILIGMALFFIFFISPSIKAYDAISVSMFTSWWSYPLFIGVNFIGLVIIYISIWFILWVVYKGLSILFEESK